MPFDVFIQCVFSDALPVAVLRNIRIFNGCKVGIETSITRVTVILSDRIFSIRIKQPLWFLFLAYSSYDNALSLKMHYCMNFHLDIPVCSQELFVWFGSSQQH